MASNRKLNVDITTGVGTFSFPKVFPSKAAIRKDGTPSYEIQILFPKTDKDSVRALLKAIKEVGESEWGDKWRQVNNPLRDGDKEKDELTEDGSTKEEKYPERLGHYFLNARSSRPVAVVDRSRVPITDEEALYGGVKGRLNVSFYPYSKQGNHGVAASLNGVQFIAGGEPFGGGRPAVESMFDMLDDDELYEYDSLDEANESDELDELDDAPVAPVKKKAPAKKPAPAKKKAPAKAVEEEDDFDLDDLDDLDG